jgi:hypothetical protein
MAHAKDVVRVRRMTTIYLNGQPISELRDLRFERVEPEAPALRPDPWTVAATGHIEDSEAFWSGLRRLFPARPHGEATVTMQWGILGPVRFPATINGANAETREENGRAIVTMPGAVDERDARRVLAMAVERAIVDPRERLRVQVRAATGENAALWPLADAVLRKRGDRKQRKAMRRLLRAAGITKGQGEC